MQRNRAFVSSRVSFWTGKDPISRPFIAPQANYFGSGLDGALTVSSNTELAVPNKAGLYDGDMVVKNYTSLSINSGATLTTDQQCRGLLIYVDGDCTINGTLSMRGRGPFANPTISGGSDNSAVFVSGLRFPFLTASGTDTLISSESLLSGCGTSARIAIANHPTVIENGTVVTVLRDGAAGGPATGGGNPIVPNPGSNGLAGQSGGGGSGGGNYSGSSAGAGSFGSCFGGGSGGGGTHVTSGAQGGAATAWGGPGGNPAAYDGLFSAPGGVGSPTPNWNNGSATGNNGTPKAPNGSGGLLVLIVRGTLSIGSSGIITAQGQNGTIFNTNNERAGGGSSGGGNIVIAHRGAFSNSGSITVAGGTAWGWGNQVGAPGGNGSVQTIQVL
jgi:hypothetical protein